MNLIVPKPLNNKLIENPGTLGEKIKNRRLELQLLQKDISIIIGVCESTITLWETNTVKPFYKYYPKILQFLGYWPFDFDETTLGGKIAKYQYMHGLSQKMLAKRLGIDESTLYNYKSNKHKPAKLIMGKLKSLIEGY